MRITHQKNIIHIDPANGRYGGRAIMAISASEQEEIDIDHSGLKIDKVEVQGGDGWVPAAFSEEAPAWTGDLEMYRKATREGGWKGPRIRIRCPAERREVRIRMTFSATEHNQAISFYEPKEDEDTHMEFVAQNIERRGAMLFPCAEDLGQRYPLDMLYILPSSAPLVVASSGKLHAIYDGGRTKTHHYKIEEPIYPGLVSFAAGLYEEAASGGRGVFYIPSFCFKAFSTGIKEICEIFRAGVGVSGMFLETRFPYEQMAVVMSACEIEQSFGRNIAIHDVSVLAKTEAIDQCFGAIKVVSRLISQQYFGSLASPPSEQDTWMYVGMAEHLKAHLVEMAMGSNEVRFDLNRDIDFIHKEDVHQPPLHSADRDRASFDSPFFVKKSGCFMKILENNLSRAFIQKIFREVLTFCREPERSALAKETGGEAEAQEESETEGRCASTYDLIRIIKGITGKDMRAMFEYYVFKSGVPTIFATVEQNQSMGGFSVTLKQKCTGARHDANKFLAGNICVRAYETDSAFDHVFFLGHTASTHELACHARPKKSKKKKEGEEEESGASLLWIRIDPAIEWMKGTVVEQADYMFAEQLISEKDVYGQMEALQGIQKNPSESVCSSLERVMGDTSSFYKVSLAAGILLAKSVNEESGYFGFQRVVQFFINNFCIQNTTIVKSNEFSVFQTYFIQKCLSSCLSLCQLDITKKVADRIVRAKNVISAFLLNLIRYNDNTSNAYDDTFYLSDLVNSLALSLCSDAYLDPEPFIEEIERLRKKDMLFPSYHNLVTCASIRSLARLSTRGYLEMDKDVLFQYLDPSNYHRVRQAAAEALVLLHFADSNVMEHLLSICLAERRLMKKQILWCIRSLLTCANMDADQYLSKYRERFVEIWRRAAMGDDSVSGLCAEIVCLLGKDVSIERGEEAQQMTHELSSEEEEPRPLAEAEHPAVKIKILLRKRKHAGDPLLLKFGCEIVKASQGVSYSKIVKMIAKREKTKEMEKERERARPKAISPKTPAEEAPRALTEEDIDAMHRRDGFTEAWAEASSEELKGLVFSMKAMALLCRKLMKNKIHTLLSHHIKKFAPLPPIEGSANAGREFAEIYEDIMGTRAGDATGDEIDGVKVALGIPAGHQPPKDSSQPAYPQASRTRSARHENPYPSLSTEIPREERGLSYNSWDFHCDVSDVFRTFFTYSIYDTSPYSSVRYYLIYFEKEFATYHVLPRARWLKLDGKRREAAIALVDELIRSDASGIFTSPIDMGSLRPYKYQEIIRNVLDLGTLRERLCRGEYYFAQCFVQDLLQIFKNCRVYNQKGSEIYSAGATMEEVAEKLIKSSRVLASRRRDDAELSTFHAALLDATESLEGNPAYAIFCTRVSHVSYPAYYSVVTHPMTLGEIHRKCAESVYLNIAHYESDVGQILQNSVKYNGGHSDITKLAKRLCGEAGEIVRRMFPWHKNRLAEKRQKK